MIDYEKGLRRLRITGLGLMMSGTAPVCLFIALRWALSFMIWPCVLVFVLGFMMFFAAWIWEGFRA